MQVPDEGETGVGDALGSEVIPNVPHVDHPFIRDPDISRGIQRMRGDQEGVPAIHRHQDSVDIVLNTESFKQAKHIIIAIPTG